MSKEQEKLNRALEALELWDKFWDDMPKGQLGNIVCNLGILNEAFLATSRVLKENKRR